MITFSLAALGALIAGVSKGGFGAGAAFLATPLLALVISPAEAAAIMLPVLIVIDQVGMISYWRKWDWSAVAPIFLFGAIGIGLGTAVFAHVSADALRLGLGIIAILFTLFQLVGLRRMRGGAVSGAVLGVATGFTSTISHAGGPPVTMHLMSRGLSKLGFQASSVLIFWGINLMKVGPYAAIGVLDSATLWRSAQLVPFAVIGVLIGIWAHSRVPERLYFAIITAALFLTGTKLIWDGAQGL